MLETGAIILEAEFPGYINGLRAHTDSLSSVTMTEYEPDRVVYRTNSSQEGMVAFSEIWYGPDKGWQAYLDGAEIDHVRLNFAIRGVRVPAGSHEIVFEFRPKSVVAGEKVSYASSIILILLLGGLIYKSYKRPSMETEVKK